MSQQQAEATNEVYERTTRALAIAFNAGADQYDIHAACWAAGINFKDVQQLAALLELKQEKTCQISTK